MKDYETLKYEVKMIDENENLKGLSLEELNSRKNLVAGFLNEIDKAIASNEYVQKTNKVAERLKEFLTQNKKFEFFRIERQRTNTGPVRHYFVNDPEMVVAKEEHEGRIALTRNIFDTFYSACGLQRTVCTSINRENIEFFNQEAITNYLDNGNITFLTREELEKQIEEDSLIYLEGRILDYRKEFKKLGLNIKQMNIITK